jgi:peptidyl-prolyl cis-trans isomerase D
MEPDFEKATFEMKVGEVSNPVLTSFGYHLIKLEAIRASTAKKFEEVRDELVSAFQKDAAERKYFDLAEKLTNMSYEMPDSLSEVAGQLDLELKQSPFFGRNGGPGIFSNPRIANAAFGDDVLAKGYNSEPLDIGENHVVVLRLREHKEASQRSLDTVKEQVKTLLVRSRAKEEAKNVGLDAVKRLQAKEADRSIAGKLGVAWKEAMDIDRKAKGIEGAIVKQAFRMTKPAGGSISYEGIVLPNGDYAIIALNKVIEGDPASVDKAEREKIKSELLNQRAGNAQEYLLATLKSHARITINEEEL